MGQWTDSREREFQLLKCESIRTCPRLYTSYRCLSFQMMNATSSSEKKQLSIKSDNGQRNVNQIRHNHCGVLTSLAKQNFPRFPGFPDPPDSLFHTVIKLKPDVTNCLSSHFGTFLAELCPPKSGRPLPAFHMGTTVAAQSYTSACCVLQIASQKKHLKHNNFRSIFEIPEFSMSFPELTNSLRFPCFPES